MWLWLGFNQHNGLSRILKVTSQADQSGKVASTLGLIWPEKNNWKNKYMFWVCEYALHRKSVKETWDRGAIFHHNNKIQ